MRGALKQSNKNFVQWGSSPQMRGARNTLFPARLFFGIIPADAGSTKPWNAIKFMHKDHPRRCGEHAHASGSGDLDAGSSPQMRGALGV